MRRRLRASARSAPRTLATLLGSLLLAEMAPADPLTARQQRLFGEICAHCHTRPGLGAPLLGVEEDWNERSRRFDTLLRNTVFGFEGMPPLGTCGSCSRADLAALVAFLSGVPEEPPPR